MKLARFAAENSISRRWVCVGVPLLAGANHWLAKPNPNTIHWLIVLASEWMEGTAREDWLDLTGRITS
jgi:hypothetical protein